jgi:hypothetical protein
MRRGGASFLKAMQQINSLDLSMVKRKLMDREEGQGWTQETADRAEKRYRRFLGMVYCDWNGSIVPTKDIDTVWHQHILDTRAYAEDCERVFGEFLHHFPYFGMRGDEDARNLTASFERTKMLYAELFDEDYVEEIGSVDAGKCVKCGKGYCHHPPRCNN